MEVGGRREEVRGGRGRRDVYWVDSRRGRGGRRVKGR